MSENNGHYKTGKCFGIFNETDSTEEHYVHICNNKVNIVTFYGVTLDGVWSSNWVY
jgi:hypothetical protein